MKQYEYRRNYELEQNYWWFVGLRKIIKVLLDLSGGISRDTRVLDVGCGTGALLNELREKTDYVVGLDNSSEALDFCRLRGHENLVLADGSFLPFKDEEFDIVTAIGVIEHITDDKRFLSELQRVLKKNGRLILMTSAFPSLWTQADVANDHKRRYNLRALEREIHKHGFSTLRFSHFNFILFPALAGMLIGHRLIKGLNSPTPERILPMPPALVNWLLTVILALEAKLIKRLRLPWGISMIGAFRKEGTIT
jgi:ubiquinone/menaquinone biosynthesis C-methylase UbiE